jgi:hypothetical protein
MSGPLPHWLERWLGGSEAGSGEGTAWTLDHSWPWASWLTLLFVVGAAAWIGFWYAREAGAFGRWRRAALVGARFALVGLLLLMIAEYVLTRHRTGLPYAVLLIDDSASMDNVDRYDDEATSAAVDKQLKAAGNGPATRINLAKSLLLADKAAVLRAIDQRYRLKLYYVSDSTRAQQGTLDELAGGLAKLDAAGTTSRLGQGIDTVLDDLRGTPPSAIILISDGINTDGPTLVEAAAQARRKGVPVFTVLVGSETPTRDLALTDLTVDEVVFVDDMVHFEFRLTATGFAGRPVKVVLREKDQTAVLAETTVKAGPDSEAQTVRLPYRPGEVGEFDYVIEVEALPEEIHAGNNRQERRVIVRKEQIRVLLVQSYPSYEFRYLKHMLERDQTILLKTVLQEADTAYAEQDKTALPVFPLRREELFEYDVVIFGDVDPSSLYASAMANLAAFVEEKGGGVVFIAGPRYMPLEYRDTPLADLMPIDFHAGGGPDPGQVVNEAFQLEPTELGLAGPTMQLGDSLAESIDLWRKLPPLYWYFEPPALKRGAHVWAEHPFRLLADGRRLPLVIEQYVGSGKTLFHATDETWRWRFRVGDVYFARYWVQTIRYLSRAKLVGKEHTAELTVDRQRYHRGEPVRLRLRFRDERQAPVAEDGVTLVVEREGDKNRRVQLRRSATNRGVFEGSFAKPADGPYHVWLVSPALAGDPPTADFLVEPPPGEAARMHADAAAMRAAATETKGRAYTIQTAAKLLDELPQGKQIKTEPLPAIPLWNRPDVLALFLTLLIGEWLLRKKWGML